MPLINDPNAAFRLARAIASDIAIYNRDKIETGLRDDNLFDALSGEFDEGQKLYQSRIDPNLLAGSNFYERAINDVILKPRANTPCKLW